MIAAPSAESERYIRGPQAKTPSASVADSSPFRPLDLPTPNNYRRGSGRPGAAACSMAVYDDVRGWNDESYIGAGESAELSLTYDDGTRSTVQLPVEMWNLGPDFAYRVPGGKHVRRAELDPRRALPDINRSNNVWPRGG